MRRLKAREGPAEAAARCNQQLSQCRGGECAPASTRLASEKLQKALVKRLTFATTSNDTLDLLATPHSIFSYVGT